MATRRLSWSLAAVALAILGGGAEPVQSALHPAGPGAAEIAWLWWVMLAAFTAVFFLVMALTGLAVFRRAKENAAPPLGRTRFIVAGGVVLPVVVLVPILFLSLETSMELRTPRDARTVRVVGHMWWWEVHYADSGIETANEIIIPAGEPVRVELESADVIHSFWVPRLGGKRDMIPGIRNEYWIQADEPGVYRGQCAEYCGTQHAKMALLVVALPRTEYDEWVSARAGPRPGPTTPAELKGFDVFRRADCGRCHAIRGTIAVGQLGPDLTHVGSRRTLGAATLPNNRGNLAGWVIDPHPLKPGVKMPASYLSPSDREALVGYLEGLK
jgi:cytochrome c oxidase subunit 2